MPAKQRRIARVEIDRELCIGAGTCVTLAPHGFVLDDEQKSTLIPGHSATDEALLMAAKGCPVSAIRLYDEDGELIYPQP